MSETFDCRLECGMDRSHIRNVEGDGKNTITLLFDEPCKLVGTACRRDHGIACLESGRNEGAAKAARGTRDEPNLIRHR